MLRERERQVLEAGIKDYITTGKPVTSESLFARHDFGIKPAMIRQELSLLCEKGYFYQNHPSGGRIPTDKAYKLFIKELMGREEEAKAPIRSENLVENFYEGRRNHFIEEMAGYLNALSVGYEPETEWFVKSGFRGMLETLELNDRDEILKVVDDFENISRRLTENVSRWREESEWPRVFLGRNPITRSNHLAVMVDRFRPEERDVFIMVIGPKRMDYEKSLGVLRLLERSNDQ